MALVELQDVSLAYPVFGPRDRTVTTTVKDIATGGFIRRTGRRSVEVCALDGIDLSATDGDRLGIVGHNGAGKTTLLKVLAGIYKPQTGSVRRTGKTASVINPSIGLSPGLSGYENIENIGLLTGLTWAEISARVPDIEEFTELGEFLSLPVETYSAGMKTRLAFAVATSLNPEILIADENLGAGDAHFLARAKARMSQMMDRSSILVVASHSVTTLKRLCNRAIVLKHGRIVADGPVEDVIANYQRRSADSPVG